MIKYEFKKNIIYNKNWIFLLLIIIYSLVFNIFNGNNLNANNEIEKYYYNQLHGEITQEKIDFIKNEEIQIKNYTKNVDKLRQQFQTNKITDQEYLQEKEILNEYFYRGKIFNDVKDYVHYLTQDSQREFINEENINNYFNNEIPYILICIIIVIVIISFQKEESMYKIIKTTKIGRAQLIKTKILYLSIINSVIFLCYFLIEFICTYNLSFLFELQAPLSSTRLFAETSFNSSILSVIIICFIMEWIAVLLLTYITSYLSLKIKINGLKLCTLEVGTYMIAFTLFFNSNWIYYIPFIGYFNPKRYFLGELTTEKYTLYSFQANERIVIFLIAILLCIVLLKKIYKSKKIPLIIIICLILSGCQNKINSNLNVEYSNKNGFNINENVLILSNEKQIIDLETQEHFALNRNVLKDMETISEGYMYHENYYYIAKNDLEWSLQRLNTKTFNQEELYNSPYIKYDIFGNIQSLPKNEYPHQLFIDNDNIYVVFDNRVETITNSNKMKLLFKGNIHIIETENNIMYYINSKNQLVSYNLSSSNKEVCLDYLVSDVYINSQYIYYIKLKDDNLYRINRKTNIEEKLITEKVNFFQVADDYVYYTLIGQNGLYTFNTENNVTKIFLNKYEIYTFSIFKNYLVFTSNNSDTHQISTYYYDGKNIKQFKKNNIK